LEKLSKQAYSLFF